MKIRLLIIVFGCLVMFLGSPIRKTDPKGALIVSIVLGVLLVAILFVWRFVAKTIKTKQKRSVLPAIVISAAEGNVDRISQLLSTGVSVDQTGPKDETALMMASRNNQMQIAILLLGAGADPAIKTVKGSTAEDIARRNGHHDMVELILGASRGK